MNFATVPEPHVIDCSKFLNSGKCEAEFFEQLAADGLLGRLTLFNAASGRAVEDKTGLRISNLRDQEGIVMPDET